MTSLAELDSRCFLGLEAAAELMSVNDIHNVVVQRLNSRTMQSRTSDINVLLGTSDVFTPDATPYDVTTLIGKGVPAWVECKQNVVDEVTWWTPVRICNENQLNDYRALGAFACAFYGDEEDSDTEQPTQYLEFTYLPVRECRIRFDRDGQRIALDADIILPDNLAELIVLESQNSLIPRINAAITTRTRRDADLRQYAKELKADLMGIYAQNLVDIKPLDAQWRVWAFRDRSAQQSFNLPTPRSEDSYPMGRANTWGGYGNWSGNF